MLLVYYKRYRSQFYGKQFQWPRCENMCSTKILCIKQYTRLHIRKFELPNKDHEEFVFCCQNEGVRYQTVWLNIVDATYLCMYDNNMYNYIYAFLGSASTIELLPPTQDDPKRRRPSIQRAKDVLGWEPKVVWTSCIYLAIPFFLYSLYTGDATGWYTEDSWVLSYRVATVIFLIVILYVNAYMWYFGQAWGSPSYCL